MLSYYAKPFSDGAANMSTKDFHKMKKFTRKDFMNIQCWHFEGIRVLHSTLSLALSTYLSLFHLSSKWWVLTMKTNINDGLFRVVKQSCKSACPLVGKKWKLKGSLLNLSHFFLTSVCKNPKVNINKCYSEVFNLALFLIIY